MKRINVVGGLGVAAVAFITMTSCGGGSELECGPGTVEQDGLCVATTTCGAGTTLQDGECVPDGSLICEQGTVYDPVVGGCVLDPSACAAGTVLLDGECVPEDGTLTADFDEAAEPNDMTGAGAFDVPALDASTTIHGCVTPRMGVRDSDPWLVTASGPALLEITADGVGGLAAGFAMIDGTGTPGLEQWIRFGINLVGDTSRRQIYLPTAGTYVLLMDDSRALILGEAGGDDDTCYYATIRHVAMPAATALTVPQTTGADQGDVRVLTFDATATGDIVDVTETTASSSLSPGFVVLRDGAFYAVAVGDTANGIPPFYTVGGLDTAGDQVTIIVDNEYNFGVVPQDYALDVFHIAGQALSTDGTPLTVTKKNGDNPTAPWWDLNYLYFDVAGAGQVVHFDLTSSVQVSMRILRRDVFTPAGAFSAVATINTSGTTTFTNQFVRFLAPGRYYFVVQDPGGTSGETFTITSTLTDMPTTAVTYGTAMTNQALPVQGSAFYSLDVLATHKWTELAVPAASNWGTGNARVTLYDLAAEGWIGSTAYPQVQSGTQPIDGSAPIGRIVAGDPRDYLVRVQDTATPGAGPTFTLAVGERAFTDLGTIVAGTPINRTGMDPLAANGVNYYLVFGSAGDRLVGTVTPVNALADLRVDRRNTDESIPSGGTSDVGLAGAAESFARLFPPPPTWVAFTVTNLTATATGTDLTLTATAPIPFTDICPTGTVLPAPFDGSADDEFSPVQALPAGFTFYGVPVTDFIVGANGFLVFGNTNPTCSFGCYSNGLIPSSSQPNHLVAPYWDDLDTIRVCRKDDAVANTVTVQWTGNLYMTTTTVAFQAVIHQDGAVDLIYGNHTATGASATVGVEDATGAMGQQLSRNTAGGAAANTSYSVTTP